MLLVENVDQIHQFVRLAEPGEEIVFFQLLVIILNERPDQLRGRNYHIWRKVPLTIDPIHDCPIDEQNTLQHAMFAHQILGQRDLFILVTLLGSRPALPLCDETRRG